MTLKQKQWQLYYLGYYSGEMDGVWGPQSKAATIRFQEDFGLGADGLFGTYTIAKSIEIIRTIQREITDGKIAIDGLAGLETRDATVQRQRENGLTPDGIAGSATRGLILKPPMISSISTAQIITATVEVLVHRPTISGWTFWNKWY